MLEVDAVGNDLIVARECVVYITVGGRRDGDVPVEPLLPTLDYRVGDAVEVLAGVRSVKSSNVDGILELQDTQGQDGGHGLVQMDDVKLLFP